MFVPLWIIAVAAALLFVFAVLAFRRGGGTGDMIERLQRDARRIGSPPPRGAAHSPPSLRSDEAAVLAVPEVRTAIEGGRKLEAIKLVREHTGLGLKEAKE